VLIGVIVRRTGEQGVTGSEGTFSADLPVYDRVALPLSNNPSLTWATHLSDCR
jgi:hypothetical protein